MGQVGILGTGAGAITTINDNETNSYILLGDYDTANALRGVNVEVGGEATINIVNNAPLCSAFAKYMSQFCATLVGLCLKVSTGLIRQKCTYRFTNDGVTTPAIFAFSESDNGKPVRAISDGIAAGGNEIYSKFTGLMIQPVASVGSLDFIFTDGRLPKTLTVPEADALFGMKNPTQADGRLDATVLTIENRDQSVQSVRVNATAALTVLPIRFSDSDFQELRNEN